MATQEPSHQLRVEIALHGQGERRPPIRAYLFDRAGNLVEEQPADKGSVTFAIDPQQAYRVTVGPAIEDTRDPADLRQQLAEAKAVTQDFLPQLGRDHLTFALYPPLWFCWWRTCILVHGTVRKGDVPICAGTVQIFEVDLGCTLDRLTSFTALSLRDKLVRALRGVARPDLTEPHLSAADDPLPGRRTARATRARLREAITAEATGSEATGSEPRAAAPADRTTLTARPAQRVLSHAEISTTLSALEGTFLRDYIVANKLSLWPFLCWFIPDSSFCWQELGEVALQSDGSFAAEICFFCPDDYPDLYFEVVQNVAGYEREIYDPQIACSTYYGYDGSRSVDIVVDDPNAITCLPAPGRPIPGDELYVWPTAIGNQDLRGITHLESATSDATTGLLSGTTPWGGTLALQMSFDPRLAANGIPYYRWSYKFDGDADFTQVSAPVSHRYMTVTYAPLMIHLHSVSLGPHTVGTTTNLFDVQGDTPPDPDPTAEWIDINDPYDRPFAYFDSTGNQLSPFTYTDALPRRSGLCTLRLEMFDAGGALIPGGNLTPGAFKFVLPDLGVPDQYTSVLTANNITPEGALTFRVRIDNDDTVAELTGVTTPTGSADDCGILHYAGAGDLVAIAYAATHPSDFLTWNLAVSRGLHGAVASTGGSTSSPPMSPPPPSLPGQFKNLASTLLGECTNAAFAVNLNTWATATDGYGRQSQYDRLATIAFALLNP